MSTRRYGVIVLAVIPAVAVASFVLVGWLAGRQDTGQFDWELASIFGTAIGTFLLAISTGVLAWTTARDVTATQEIARLTREDRAERLKPIVMGTVTRLDSDTDGPFASVELHNIGDGPAIRIMVTLEYVGRLLITPGVNPVAALGGGDTIPIAVRLGWVESVQVDEVENFRVRGEYRDRLEQPVDREVFDWLRDEPPIFAE